MRWTSQYPEDAQIRIRHRFLFFPKTINEHTRWLEWATWSERYHCNTVESFKRLGFIFIPHWSDIQWVDKEVGR